jgi:hypothetical protein
MNNKPVNYAQGGRGGAPPPQPMYNPPAFPTSHEEPSDYNGHNNSKKIVIDQGMTLRDYMAAKAMQVILQSQYEDAIYVGDGDNDSEHMCANSAYIMADAMLKAREA